jgi:type IV pilus assembly protein PilA
MSSTKCVQCGFVGSSDLENCKSCGAPLRQSSFSQASRSHYDQPEGQKRGLAIASLVLGLICFVSLGMLAILSIPGIILGAVALHRAKREPWIYGGRGMAIAGLVLSITFLASTFTIGVIAAIAIPNLLASARAANEASAIHSLRTISSAEETYQSNFKNFGTLEELAVNGLIDPKLASGTKNGYTFCLIVDSSNPEGFAVTGVPVTYGTSGGRSFYVDETLVIRAADKHGAQSSNLDPPLDP